MIDFKENIAQKISEVTNIDKEELKTYIEIPPNSDLGDYAFPCFKLAKSLRKAPPVIASEIKEAIKLDDGSIEKIEIVGGYLNIYINKASVAETVLKKLLKSKKNMGQVILVWAKMW